MAGRAMTPIVLATVLGATLAGLDLLVWGYLSLMRIFGGTAR
jgi:hypothetical protein